MSAVIKHEETRTPTYTVQPPVAGLPFGVGERTGTQSKCGCGEHWSHPVGRTPEEMDAIFASHVKYFERETVVL